MGFDVMDVFVKIGADTSGLEKGIGKAKGLAGGLGGAIGGAMKIAGVAIGAATTAVGAFAKSAIDVGKTFDASMSQVAATMGVTTDEIGELTEFAQEMGRTTAFSATQAAEALNYMALAGYDAETSMKMLPNVLNLAAAGGMDLASASDMVTDAQTALGLSLEETTELVDMMALTSSKTNTSVSQLGDAILTIGGTAKNLAGGTTELNQMLGVLADNGIKASEGGTHLRNVILSLSAPTDNAAAALEELGIETKDMYGNLRPLPDLMGEFEEALDGLGTAERADIISTIFNKTDIAAVNALIDTSADRYDELETEINGAWIASKNFTNGFQGTSIQKMQDRLEAAGVSVDEFQRLLKKSGGNAGAFVEELSAISGMDINDVLQTMGTNLRMLQTEFDNVEGSAEQMAQTQLDNLAGDITLWKSAMEGAQLLISGALAPELREFVQFGTEGLTKISDAFKEGGLSGAMDAFGEVLSDGIGMITEKIPEFLNAGMELLGALGQGLIDNIPQLVDAATQIGVQILQGVLKAAPELAKGAITLIKSLGESLRQNAPQLLNMGSELLNMLWTGITEGLPLLAQGAVELMGNLASYLQEAIPQILPVALNALMEFSGSLRENAGLLVDGALNLIMTLAQGLIDSLPVMIQTIPTIVSNIAGIINDNAPKLIATGIELIGKLVIGIVEAIPTIIAEFPKIIQAIFDVLMAVNWVQLGSSIITGIGNGIKALAQDLPTTLKNIGTQAVEWLKTIQWSSLGRDIIDLIVIGIKALLTAIPNLLKTIGRSAVSAFKSINWLEVGKFLVTGIVSGISNAAHLFYDAIANLAKQAWEGIKDFFKIESPSKRMMWVGEMLDAGLAKGIEQFSYLAEDAMNAMSNGVVELTPQLAMAGGGSLEGGLEAGYNQTVNIYSPTALDPSEVARQTRNATRDMVLELRGKR